MVIKNLILEANLELTPFTKIQHLFLQAEFHRRSYLGQTDRLSSKSYGYVEEIVKKYLQVALLSYFINQQGIQHHTNFYYKYILAYIHTFL